ncbi:unnamed protein product [Cylindrotheca closterium]|uniref:Uncharacterized protein n=1 Tax=Cylindrotheca closterium TaxID=2856 RepID=A0AAD2JMX2_9STRA|nr:unnamed protein product [Cylindrotheca closterium]
MSSNAYGSNTVNASQNRIQRLRQQNQETRHVSPAANNLLQKRKQMKERRMKRAESVAAASSSTTGTQKANTSQQDAIPRRRKLEMVQRHKAHRQANNAMGKPLNDDRHNLSPRSADNEDADDDTLVSVRRIVASSSPGNQQDQHYLNVASSKSGSTAYHFQEQQQHQHQQSYQSNYNSLSENMHSLQKKKTPTKRNGHSRPKKSEQRPWLEDEKSEKVNNRGSYLTASSSEYDTDKESQMMGLEGQSYSKSADANDYNSSPLHKQNKNGDNYYSSRAYPRRFYDDDDKTFDYGDRDDDYSADSGSYAARRWKEAERRKALAAELDSPKENSSAGNASESPFINKEDAEHFRQKMDSMDSPALRIGVGVAGAATIGAVIGPVGLLVGAAAISVGFSLSQIPEEDRSKLQTKATQSMHEFHDKACEMSDKLSNTCATHYHESGVAEHIPPQIAENLPQCISNPDDQVLDDDGVVDDNAPGSIDNGKPTVDTSNRELPSQNSLVKPSGVGNFRNERVSDPRLPVPTKQPERPYPQNKRKKKVACLRNVRILPAGRIYGLDPVAQPRAWLDVVASANTSYDEKTEAMEEILILAKDKRRARILLEEGILDYIIWQVGRYMEKVNHTTEDWKYPKLTPDEEHSARQAATCCVTLGKAHCAAIHTEGDLQLMSLYERGIVPEDRQVAQMLHEVPHHVRITKTSDPTIVDPTKEVFAYRELELPQAEELAKSIKLVADGKM